MTEKARHEVMTVLKSYTKIPTEDLLKAHKLIVDIVDKDMANAIMKGDSIGEILDLVGLEIRARE